MLEIVYIDVHLSNQELEKIRTNFFESVVVNASASASLVRPQLRQTFFQNHLTSLV